MTLQDECRLSFYEDAWMLSEEHNVCLVRHIETGRLYVRKVLSAYNLQVYPNAQQAVEMSLRSGFLIVYRKLAECTNMEIAGYPATKVTIIGDQGSELSNLATSKIHIYDVENQRTIVFGIFLRTEDEMAFKYDYDE